MNVIPTIIFCSLIFIPISFAKSEDISRYYPGMSWNDFNKEVSSRGLGVKGPIFGDNYLIVNKKNGLPESGGIEFCGGKLSSYSENIGSNNNYINTVQYFIGKFGKPENISVSQRPTDKAGYFVTVESIEWQRDEVKYHIDLSASVDGYMSGGAAVGFDSLVRCPKRQ